MAISQPPPNVIPNGADTTGLGAYLIAMVACWKGLMAGSNSSHSSSWEASSTSMRFAPTLKFSPWLATIMASKFLLVSSMPARIRETWSSPSEFILLWNSRQSTPSPMSINDAPPFFFTTPCACLTSLSTVIPGLAEPGGLQDLGTPLERRGDRPPTRPARRPGHCRAREGPPDGHLLFTLRVVQPAVSFRQGPLCRRAHDAAVQGCGDAL